MEDLKIETNIQKSLDQLIFCLQKKEEIIQYQEAEKKIEENQPLKQLIARIKEKQKQLVHLEHYQKPAAYEAALKELDLLNRELDENISVQYYKQTLFDANEIVQLVFSRIQEAVSDPDENFLE